MPNVEGSVPHDDVDTGNPVKMGGNAQSGSQAAVAAGDRVNAWFNRLGALMVGGTNAGGAGADGLSDVVSLLARDAAGLGSPVPTTVLTHLYNGASIDRQRGNTDLTVLASAARTASVDSADQTNHNAKGLHLVIDVTAITLTPSITVTIQGKDALSGKYYTILASAAITATGTTVLRVHPGLTAAANTVANDILPRTWRVSVAALDADSITYSIGASLVVG